MRLVAISCVKNEIDIVEAFARHTLRLVDQLVVLDNGSTDGTLKVLQQLEQEGLSLKVVEDPSIGMYQSQRMTRLMREYAIGHYAADWVLPLDVDEFLVVRIGAPLVPADADPRRPLVLPWRGYVPSNGDDLTERNPVLRIRHRLAAEAGQRCKVMVPASVASMPGATLRQGNHVVLLNGLPCSASATGAAYLGHFPVRSPGQFVAKMAVGWLQYVAMPRREPNWAVQQRLAYQLLRQAPGAAAAALPDFARRYSNPTDLAGESPVVHDPLPYRGGPLTHTPSVEDATLGFCALLDYAEKLAQTHAALVADRDQETLCRTTAMAGTLADLYRCLAEQSDRLRALEEQLAARTRTQGA